MCQMVSGPLAAMILRANTILHEHKFIKLFKQRGVMTPYGLRTQLIQQKSCAAADNVGEEQVNRWDHDGRPLGREGGEDVMEFRQFLP